MIALILVSCLNAVSLPKKLFGFNDHQSHYSGSCIFGYTSAPAAAREVFKPSTDSASLVVSSQKKIFQFRVRGSLGGASQVGVFSRFYGLLCPALDANRMGPHFLSNIFMKLGRVLDSHESLEPSIAFLAYLDQNLCHKNQKLLKISTRKKLKKDKITPLLDMAITRH